jgi:uncharacterized membrane protein
MSEAMQLMIADFNTPDGAKNTFKRVKEDKLRRGDAAILAKTEDGKIKVKEVLSHQLGGSRFSLKRGAAAGLVAGLMALVTGPAMGAVTGVLAADALVDVGFPNDKLKTMAETLAPNHSMLVMITDLESVPAVKQLLEEYGGQLISYLMSADLVGELKKAVESDDFQINVPVDADE